MKWQIFSTKLLEFHHWHFCLQYLMTFLFNALQIVSEFDKLLSPSWERLEFNKVAFQYIKNNYFIIRNNLSLFHFVFYLILFCFRIANKVGTNICYATTPGLGKILVFVKNHFKIKIYKPEKIMTIFTNE